MVNSLSRPSEAFGRMDLQLFETFRWTGYGHSGTWLLVDEFDKPKRKKERKKNHVNSEASM